MPPVGDSQLAELLRRGPEIWNAQRPSGWLNLADLDLDDLDLRGADLSKAGMWGCNLQRTDLSDANLDGADLSDATLCRARLIRTSVQGTNFANAWVYGAAIWDLQGVPSNEDRLSIVPDGPGYFKANASILRLEFGGLRVAQFISSAYSALNGTTSDPLMSGLVDALSTRLVLLLGRFNDEEHRLKELASILKNQYAVVPMVFDFDAPNSRDLTETVTLWARLCSFIVADLTDPASVPHELASIVPFLPSVPVFPIIKSPQRPFSMLEHWQRFPWVHSPMEFADRSGLETITATIVAQARQSRGSGHTSSGQ